ncbi:uncharacterized protein [Dysidea avara]|uniref:uncharacterized protein isoform X2 n=1 Tax=Dysidea avara TaxID=196820 RepID=UPI003325A5EA
MLFKLGLRLCYSGKLCGAGIHTVSEEHLTQYYNSLRYFKSRGHMNVALCKLRGKDQPAILTDKWPDFSCTAILQHWTSTQCFPTRNQQSCRLLLLSDSEEDFTCFIHDSKLLEERAMITAIDSVTNGYLDRVAKTMFPQWQETTTYSYQMSHFSGNIDDLHTEIKTDEYFIDELSVDHADFIAEHFLMNSHFAVNKSDVSKYFKHIFATYNLTAAAFIRSNPTYPVSWGMYGDYGHAVYWNTLPEHQQKGLGFVITARLWTKMIQQGIVPVIEQHKDHLMFGKFNKIIKPILGSTWRDSITGECYW